jgi:uncharacterized protein (DUF4415 family)
MQNETNIRRFSAARLRELRASGESQTDIQRVRAKTQAQLEKDIAEDEDWKDIPADWYREADAVMPTTKRMVSIRLDPDVLDWFKGRGSGYQTRINSVLRAYMNQVRKNTG